MIDISKISTVHGKRRRHRVEVFAFGPNNTILANLDSKVNFPELPGGGIDGRETNKQ